MNLYKKFQCLKLLKLKKKKEFYGNETLIFLKDADIEKVLVSSKISLVKRSINTLLVVFIMIIKVKPLHILFPKTSVQVKSYDGQSKDVFFD